MVYYFMLSKTIRLPSWFVACGMGVVCEIVLMVGFCRVECLCWGDFGHNGFPVVVLVSLF